MHTYLVRMQEITNAVINKSNVIMAIITTYSALCNRDAQLQCKKSTQEPKGTETQARR